jgi:hypothetical protein
VLLAKDNSGVLYGADGRPSRRSSGGAVTWSAAPAVLAISQPYALALTESGAEARLLQPLNAADLRQQLAVTLPDAAATCTVAPTVAEDGSLFVARRGDGTIQQASIEWRWRVQGSVHAPHHFLLLQSTNRLRLLLLCGKAESVLLSPV